GQGGEAASGDIGWCRTKTPQDQLTNWRAFAIIDTRCGYCSEQAGGGADPMRRIKRATSPHVPEPAPGTWSNCLVVGGIAYLAGMTARGADLGDEYTQSKAIFAKIRHLVEAAGGNVAHIVKVTV